MAAVGPAPPGGAATARHPPVPEFVRAEKAIGTRLTAASDQVATHIRPSIDLIIRTAAIRRVFHFFLFPPVNRLNPPEDDRPIFFCG